MCTTTLRETRKPPAGSLEERRPAAQPIVSPDRGMPPAAHPEARTALAHEAVLALPAEARWVPVARRCVVAVLTQWRFPSADRESAELIVGELAANAAEHGRHDMTVHLSLHKGVLWISVTDSGVPGRPRRTARQMAEATVRHFAFMNRGLHLTTPRCPACSARRARPTARSRRYGRD
ncbi:hypothetical protein SUDANB105_06785 [Streptomyces sp. enrichment culture]|uniref:ATP-binding protein n=1 Tax=Streptomyces sp. enrichment culture TaxID=1795815 RepID=UPI003F56226C